MQLPIMQSQDLDETYARIISKRLKCCELSRVIVADGCRGTGLSGALVRFAMGIVGRLDIDLSYLECIPGHQSLYEKHGFRRLEVEQKQVVDVNKTMIAMVLERSPPPVGGSPWPETADLLDRSYSCCCRNRDCFQGRYELYGTLDCPMVAGHYYHNVLCRAVNLGRLER